MRLVLLFFREMSVGQTRFGAQELHVRRKGHSMKRGHIALVLLCLLIVAALVYLFLFGPQTFAVLSINKKAKEAPELSLVPKSLPTSESAPGVGSPLKYWGYQFQPPWAQVTKIEEERHEEELLWVRLFCESGQEISFDRPLKNASLLRAVQEEFGMKEQELRATLGLDPLCSEYELWETLLSATPGDIRILMPTKKAVQLSMLLTLKAYVAPSGAAIYRFSHDGIRGFQFGEPSEDKLVGVVAFDTSGTKLSFCFSAGRLGEEAFTQEQVNTVIFSLRKVQE